MARITLKKILRNGGEAVIQSLFGDERAPIGVWDAKGKLLLGEPITTGERQRVITEGETLGWVTGEAWAAGVAVLLSYLAAKELAARALADEVLDHYREVNLLYNLSEKLTGLLEPAQLAEVVLKEAARLIQTSAGLVAAFGDNRAEPETLLNPSSSSRWRRRPRRSATEPDRFYFGGKITWTFQKNNRARRWSFRLPAASMR